MQAPRSELALQIKGMDCANCALTLERGVARLEGVEHVQVNFTTATLEAVGSLDPEAIVARVHALGYQVADGDAKAAANGPREARQMPGGVAGFVSYLWQDRATAVALAGAALLLLSLPLTLADATPALTWSLERCTS